MAGFKEFAHEIRRRATHYSTATVDHVAIYALDSNRVYIINDDGTLSDFTVSNITCHTVDVSGYTNIGGIINVSGEGYFWSDVGIAGELDVVNNAHFHSAVNISGNIYYGGYIGAMDGKNERFGSETLINNTTGDKNTAVGKRSMYSNTTGFENTALGTGSLFSNIDGSGNTAAGVYSLSQNSSGYQNTGIGGFSLFSNTTGVGNVAVGYGVLKENTSGYGNVAIGSDALNKNTTGYHNVASGFNALFSNTTGVFNVASGHQALSLNTTGSGNVAYGKDALINNAIGQNNVGIGSWALYENTTGVSNVGIGTNALLNNSTGTRNVAIGFGAGRNETESNKLYIDNYYGDVSTSGSALIYGEFDTGLLYTKGQRIATVGAVSGFTTGDIVARVGNNPPPEGVWYDCNGQNISRLGNPALFIEIGTIWGNGDGSSTFGTPDFRRRVLMGAGGTATGIIGNTVGSYGGEEAHTLTIGEMPSHSHDVTVSNSGNTVYAFAGNATIASGSTTSTSQGSGQSHNIIQPSAVVKYWIKA